MATFPTLPLSVPSLPRIPLPAESLYKRLRKQIKEFVDALATDEAVSLSHPAANGVFDVRDIGFHDSDLIVLSGFDQAGRRGQLLVHVDNIQLAIVAVSKDASKGGRKIGFSGEIATGED